MAGWTPVTRATRTRCAGTPLVLICWLLPGMMGWCGCGGLVLNVVFVVFSGAWGVGGLGCGMGWNCGVYVVSGDGWDMWMSVCGPLAGSRNGTRDTGSFCLDTQVHCQNGTATASYCSQRCPTAPSRRCKRVAAKARRGMQASRWYREVNLPVEPPPSRCGGTSGRAAQPAYGSEGQAQP